MNPLETWPRSPRVLVFLLVVTLSLLAILWSSGPILDVVRGTKTVYYLPTPTTPAYVVATREAYRASAGATAAANARAWQQRQSEVRTAPSRRAAPAFSAAEFLAFARTCGRYLRDGKLNHVLALTAPTPQLREYRDSLVLLVATAVLAGEGRRTYAEVIQVYGRYDRAVIPLGNLYTQLVAAGCWPETAIGEAYEAIKQAARAVRDRNR